MNFVLFHSTFIILNIFTFYYLRKTNGFYQKAKLAILFVKDSVNIAILDKWCHSYLTYYFREKGTKEQGAKKTNDKYHDDRFKLCLLDL